MIWLASLLWCVVCDFFKDLFAGRAGYQEEGDTLGWEQFYGEDE